MPRIRGRRSLPRLSTTGRPFKKVRGLCRSIGSAKCNRVHQRQADQLEGSLYQNARQHSHAGSATRFWERGRRLRALVRSPQQHPQVGGRASAHNNPERANDTNKHPPAPESLASSPAAAPPCPRAERVRQKQQELRDRELKERQALAEQYQATGDLTVFSSIMSPFLPQAELGDWQWDDEVEWWWRENKATGRKLWAPTEYLFS